MEKTKSRWSVVCGFNGEIYSGHRTEEMANKKAEEIRKGLWTRNMKGKYWERECAIRRLRASDSRYPKFVGKYLLPLAPELGVDPGDPRYPDIMGKYRHSCGSLAAYVQVVPAGSWFSRIIPADNDSGSVEIDEPRWVVPTDAMGEGYRDALKPVPDFEAAGRARLAAEAEEEAAERFHARDDCPHVPLSEVPAHIVAMAREAEIARDADIPLAEGHSDE